MTTVKSGLSSCDLGVARLRRSLSKAERQAYEAHLATCEDCRVLLQLHLDMTSLGDVLPGDDAVIAQAMRASLARVSPARPARPARVRRALPGMLLAALWVSISAGAVLAGREVFERLVAWNEPPPSSATAGRPRRGHATSLASPEGRRTSNGAPSLASAEPPAPSSSFPSARPRRQNFAPLGGPSSSAKPPTAIQREVAAAAPLEHPSAMPSPESKTELQADSASRRLLAEAIAVRARGDRAQALELLQQLQLRFPNSNEALVALISSGQLQLASGNPSGALESFNGYRRRVPAGALSEEALDGAARSLAGLQRFAEERAVWRELLMRFPKSAYQARALDRLGDSRK